jgi:hypothetical protein
MKIKSDEHSIMGGRRGNEEKIKLDEYSIGSTSLNVEHSTASGVLFKFVALGVLLTTPSVFDLT